MVVYFFLSLSRISNISMETAVDVDEAPEGMEVARLVEMCECPPGYAGLSCQVTPELLISSLLTSVPCSP